jgi:Arc/MetJ-type ribon-helix-helix transcriptional regulator
VYTNRATGHRGGTVVVTVRLPAPVVEFIDAHLDDELRNRGEVLQHAVAAWCIEKEESDV